MRPEKLHFTSDEEKAFHFRIEQRGGLTGGFFIGAHLYDQRGQQLVQYDSRMVGDWLPDLDAHEGVFRFTTPWLMPGEYRLDIYIGAGGLVDLFEGACRFSVDGALPYPNAANADATSRGVVFGDFRFEFKTNAPQPPSNRKMASTTD